jgi:hypothetical protein
MKDSTKLVIIKSSHSLVWIVMVAATFYILYAGITGTRSILLWVSIVLLCIESLVLLVNGWVCPFTTIAMKYTSDRTDNFDIYIPLFIARYNKMVFGTIFIIGLLLLIF